MPEQQPNDDLFQSLRNGFSDFGKKMSNFVDDVLSSETLSSELKVRADVFSAGGFYVIELELPGVQKEAVSLQVHDGILTVRGEKTLPEFSNEAGYYKQERRFGSFMRSFSLPLDVELENIKAKYDSGVLTVRFPQPQPKQQPPADESEINID